MSSAVLARMSGREGDARAAVVHQGTIVPYSAIVDGARRCGSGLLGGRSSLCGARVALLAEPGALFVQAFYGILYAGGCAVVLSPLHPAPEMRWMCSDAEVECVIATAAMTATASAVCDRVRGAESLLQCAPGPLPSPLAVDPALQLYTSGTTGKPKGAVLTHDNLSMQQEVLGEAWEMCESDMLLHALPLHHMHGLCIALLTALGAGASVRMLPRFDANAVWDSMGSSTVWMAVPTMYAKLMAAFDAADPETRRMWGAGARGLRLATSGSAALPVSLGLRWNEVAGAYPVERFGMSEIGVGASNPVHGERKPGTVGLPLRTVELKVVDDELWIAGPSVFAEYHKRPEATAAAFVVEGGKRWFRSGDTVALDADGYVRILGRTSVDILKSGGYKLSALEIEEALRGHPAVAEVAVIGIADETWGERVVACVVAHAGREQECGEEPLRAFAMQHLAPYKAPRTVVLMDQLPRNAMGKVMKPALQKLVRELSTSRSVEPRS
jgi:malonyl-CoA/methylmalonyl-CoA synthetase